MISSSRKVFEEFPTADQQKAQALPKLAYFRSY